MIKSEFGLNMVPKWVLICHPKAPAQATGFGFCKPESLGLGMTGVRHPPANDVADHVTVTRAVQCILQ